MVDIAAALTKLANAILGGYLYKKTQIIDPMAMTVTTSPQPLTAQLGGGECRVAYVGIEVRDLGTATYVRVGTSNNINSSLTVKGAYQEFESPRGTYIDMNKIFVQSDTADAVIEITGVRIPDEGE